MKSLLLLWQVACLLHHTDNYNYIVHVPDKNKQTFTDEISLYGSTGLLKQQA